MPLIHNKTIHSFSSEDPAFPAKNLLDNKNTARWKCKTPGEKQAFVVLKLSKPYHIDKLDIGNEWSAFMEVLVGNSKQDPPEFKEILFTSSFMTEKEARSEFNPNRIRFFEKQSLVESVASQQWDLVKIICTQPYNTRKQFGIAFISLYTPDEVEEEEEPPRIFNTTASIQKSSPSSSSKATKKIGKFVFKDSSDEEDEEDESSPFQKWRMKKEAPKPDLKTQIKAKLEETRKRVRSTSNSSSEGASEKKISKPKAKIENRNRSKGLLYDSEDDEPNERLQKKIDKDREKEEKSTPKPPAKSPAVNKFSSFIDKSPSTSSKSSTSVKPPTPKKEPQYKPFDKLLDGVTFVISGYQNPERGILRQKALDMGAKYKGDWDSTCTHLICAFANTPKFNQVKGKGKIVSAKWIENCFREQKRLPWRRFAMDRDDKTGKESEDEILCELTRPKKDENENISDDSDGDMLVVDHRKNKKTPEKKVEVRVDDSDDDDMVVVVKQPVSPPKITIDDDDDADNENKASPHDDEQKENEISYDSESSIDITAVECEAFKGKIFYLNQDLPSTTVLKFPHIIKHMLGVVTKDPSKAHYIITRDGKNLPKNSRAEIVKDTWIQECHELQAFIPTTRYRL